MKKLLNISISIIFLIGLIACNAAPTMKAAPTTSTPHISKNAKQMTITFINVGQGDSILIQTPNGKAMLVDGGRRVAGDKVVSDLKKYGITTIDRLVATHPDADHIGGLIDVLKNFPVKKVIDSGKDHTSDTYMDYLKWVDQKNIPFHVAKTGEKLQLDPALTVKVLNSGNTAPTEDNNEASVVLKITYGKISVLLTGDAPQDVEKQMMERGDVQATILKPGHHGSSTSSSLAFLQAVHPEVAVLSYGENDYGHPNADVVSRLRQVGAKVYSTYASGDIVIKTDGETYNVNAKPWNGKGVEGDPQAHYHTQGKININTASLGELESINGIGPTIAQHIIDYRNAHGPFKSIDQLEQVERIGPSTIEKIRPYITLK